MIDGVDAVPQVSADNTDASHTELNGNCSSMHPSGGIVSEFFENLDNFLAAAKPAGKQLDRDSEKTLARYCYVLALFEEVFRAGPWPASILFRQQYESVEELLRAIPSQSVDDIAQMSNIVYHRFEPHFGEPVTLNPTFEGSLDVSGADGDFFLNDCLIDFKATIKPRMSPEWLRQLVGYVLLDYSDMHHLDSVGIFLVRQDVLFRWPLDEFIQTLCDEKSSLPLLRQEFRKVTQSA